MKYLPIETVELVDGWRTRDLRRRVLRPNLGKHDPLPADDRADAIHFAAFGEDGKVASTCILLVEPCPWRPVDTGWQLRQVATAPEQLRRGYGAVVYRAVALYIAAAHGGTLWCYAREQAVPFYLSLHFIAEGELFIDDAHPTPHLRMWRSVDRSLSDRFR